MSDDRGTGRSSGIDTAGAAGSAARRPWGDPRKLLTEDGFSAALDHVPQPIPSLEVDGRTIARRQWGHAGTGVVLVHGGSANSRWWDHIGPALGAHHRVVALDMSGHGDSTYPGTYSFRRWADEVTAVCEELAWATKSRPLVVGHSMGGIATLVAAAGMSSCLAGIVVLDSSMRTVPEAEIVVRRARAQRPPPRYVDPAEARARFRVVPESTSVPAYVLDHLADTSLRRYNDGWGWAFDMRIFGQSSPTVDELRPVGCPGLIVRASDGLLTEDIANAVVDRAELAGAVVMENCGHHIPLERPDGVVGLTLRAAVGWAR